MDDEARTRGQLMDELWDLRRQVAILKGSTTGFNDAEEALRASHNRYSQLFRSMVTGLALHEVILDEDGRPRDYRFLEVNPAFERLTGLRAEDLVGRTVLEVLPGTEPIWIEKYGRVATTGETIHFESYSRELHRHYEVTAYTPEPGRFVTIFQDVTGRKQAEEERQKLEQKIQQTQKLESLGVLAGGIAHDFNNILMAVLGHAELALDQLPPTAGARGNIREIETAARRAAELCRQMLAYSGRASITTERVSLSDLIEEIAQLLKTSVSKKAILNLHLERGLPCVQADPSQIRQVVMNLILNASEAIGDRSGVITVTVGATRCDKSYLSQTFLENDLPAGLYIHLEVSDTGEGMDPKTMRRIFEPFFTTKFAGRGLGLAAVLGIVRSHKGALRVYSEPGKGTTFKVLFPALDIAECAGVGGEVAGGADWRGSGTVLLVDDEPTLRALGSMMLERLGFTVLTASDGLEAVATYRERGGEIGLVLLDMTMPHMDGAQAFAELRQIDPKVRVVLTSGYSEEDVAARFAGRSLGGVLQKPFTVAKLRQILADLMP